VARHPELPCHRTRHLVAWRQTQREDQWRPRRRGIVVGVTVFFLVIVASIDLLSVVPANVYGYAALVAYSLHQPSAAPATGPLQNLISPSFANPLVLLIVSMVIGALFGYASDQLAKVLPTKLPTRAAHA
jgi:hypothetical protein